MICVGVAVKRTMYQPHVATLYVILVQYWLNDLRIFCIAIRIVLHEGYIYIFISVAFTDAFHSILVLKLKIKKKN